MSWLVFGGHSFSTGGKGLNCDVDNLTIELACGRQHGNRLRLICSEAELVPRIVPDSVKAWQLGLGVVAFS